MKPYEFEQLVCDHYRQKGYRVQTTSASNDYGIDVFAEKKGEKIAVQVKMYGGSTRKVNLAKTEHAHPIQAVQSTHF